MNIVALEKAFAENFDSGLELGAAVSVWKEGKEIISLCAGSIDKSGSEKWAKDTLCLLWSAGKGLAASALLLALHEKGIGISTKVAELWEEFAQAGKGQISIAELLSHQAGLSALDQKVNILDYEMVIKALEKQAANWKLSEKGSGYHPRTYGFLLNELLNKVLCKEGSNNIGQYWRERIAEPLGLDIYFGLPEALHSRCADVYPPKISPDGKEEQEELFWSEMASPQSLTSRAFRSPSGLQAVTEMNQAETRKLCLPALGGIGSASSLAKYYSCLANRGSKGEAAIFPAQVIEQLAEPITPLAGGQDRVLHLPISFSAGMQLDPLNEFGEKLRKINGPSLSAFGHPGAGGCHGFTDPENGIGFAYLMNQMGRSILPNARCQRLVEALYSS